MMNLYYYFLERCKCTSAFYIFNGSVLPDTIIALAVWRTRYFVALVEWSIKCNNWDALRDPVGIIVEHCIRPLVPSTVFGKITTFFVVVVTRKSKVIMQLHVINWPSRHEKIQEIYLIYCTKGWLIDLRKKPEQLIWLGQYLMWLGLVTHDKLWMNAAVDTTDWKK